MFRNRNQRIKMRPEQGDHVRLRARVSLYEGRGEFQLIVEHMEPAGAGALQAAFEKLKAKLLAEGLFNPETKQPLPDSISHLGVVTSPSGAAIHDILQVLKRRWPAMEIYLLPTAVQGDSAASEIVAAIGNANRWHGEGKIQLDALIVGRGGGSLEDLWPFNEEIVARAIAASALPVISAVGHEVDFTISDMVADHRAPTPSAAAELVSPDQQEWRQRLASIESDLLRQIRRKLSHSSTELHHLQKRLKHPGTKLREQSQRLDDLEQRLLRAQQNQLRKWRVDLAALASRLQALSPTSSLQGLQREAKALRQRLDLAIQQRLKHSRERLAHQAQLLDTLSPLGTLQRGYAIVSDTGGNILVDTAKVKVGDEVHARLATGKLGLRVEKVER
jgi:exodeoxyribonuclease VII large subunit